MFQAFFARKEDIFRLCDSLESWLQHVQRQAECGFQFKVGSPAKGLRTVINCLIMRVLVSDNTILVNQDGQKVCYYTYNVINQLITSDPVFCKQVEKIIAQPDAEIGIDQRHLCKRAVSLFQCTP